MKYGFTLIEVIVSLGIIAILGLAVSQIFISTVRTNTKTEILKEVKQTGEFTMEAMVRMIQNADSVTSICSGSVANSISVKNLDGIITTFGCVAQGSVYRVASISAAGTVYLTSSNVSLGGGCSTPTLRFTCQSTLGLPNKVFIEMDLADANTSPDLFEQSSASFQTSVVTRNVPTY